MNKSTPPPQPVRLTDRSTLNSTIEVLEQHFDLSADGYLCQTRDLWQVLVAVCARQSTVESTCNDLEDAPDCDTRLAALDQIIGIGPNGFATPGMLRIMSNAQVLFDRRTTDIKLFCDFTSCDTQIVQFNYPVVFIPTTSTPLCNQLLSR